MIELRLPLRQIIATQEFGKNYLNFYKQWGIDGHNGVDFRAMDGFKCYATHNGKVIFSGSYSDGCIGVEIWDYKNLFKTCYLHLKKCLVKNGEEVVAGQIIGLCDNTGLYTTGNHLHFGLKETDKNGDTLNSNNGYKGSINPTPYFLMAYDGTRIKNQDWDKSNCMHRYFRKDGRNLINEIKIMIALRKYFKKNPSHEQIAACVYGGWGREDVDNIAMRPLYAFITKENYLNGERPFQD